MIFKISFLSSSKVKNISHKKSPDTLRQQMRQCVHMIRFIDNYTIIVMSGVGQKPWCLGSLIAG